MNFNGPKDNQQGFKWIIGGVIAVLLVVVVYQLLTTRKAEDKFSINDNFSYTGAYYPLEEVIKENMDDPDSYEHVKTTKRVQGGYVLLETKFRGTNKFGAKVLQGATATVDQKDGHILKWNFD